LVLLPAVVSSGSTRTRNATNVVSGVTLQETVKAMSTLHQQESATVLAEETGTMLVATEEDGVKVVIKRKKLGSVTTARYLDT